MTARTLSQAKTAMIAVDVRALVAFVVVNLIALPLILTSGAELLRGP